MQKRPGFPPRADEYKPVDRPTAPTRMSLPEPHDDDLPPEPPPEIEQTPPWRIEGGLVPVLHIEVGAGRGGIYFEPRDILWKEDGVLISAKDDGGIVGMIGGMLKRSIAGVNLILAQATGHGHTALTRGEPGCLSAIPMKKGAYVCLRDGAFLAATDGISCGFERIQGIGNALLGGTGMFMGTFHAERDGTLFVHGLGDTTVMDLEPLSAIEAAQHGWLWKDGNVGMDTVTAGVGNALVGSGSLLLHRFTGPGRVGLQSGRRIPVAK